jgi:hypothetical protein
MILSDIFEQLQYGELAHLAVGQLDDAQNQKQVVAHLNLALLELHKRFWLISKNLIIQTYPELTEYIIDEAHLVSNQVSPESYKYILDSASDPFSNDLLKIEAIFDSEGEELPLNDENRDSSFFTPQYNILRSPSDFEGEVVLVRYRAKHPKIDLDCDSDQTEILLPDAYLEPLLLYIAHRASRILNSDTNQESNNYYQQYEAACKAISDKGYEIRPYPTNMKLDVNGWV